MARIMVTGSGRAAAEVTRDDNGVARFDCACGHAEVMGYMEDTIQEAEVHVDIQCPLRHPIGKD